MTAIETYGDELVYRYFDRPHDLYVHLEGDRYWAIYAGDEVRLERPSLMRVVHHGVRLRDLVEMTWEAGERAVAALAAARESGVKR